MSTDTRTHSRVKVQPQVGDEFDHLVIVGLKVPNRPKAVLCRCVCGAELPILYVRLLQKRKRSCGCQWHPRPNAWKHKPEYVVWKSMLQRCYHPKSKRYARWGGRGIKVCQRWRESFLAFLEDMGPRPTPAHQIDRKNNDGHYEPTNCRWATRLEQARNQSTNRVIEFNGESMILKDWAERIGIKSVTLAYRLNRGWSVEDAMTKPLMTTSEAAAKGNAKRGLGL
jgi:hypothetical protein